MWIGDKKETDRIIIQWKPIKDYFDDKGQLIAQDFEPQHPQKKLIISLDKSPISVYDYKVDLKTRLLVKK